MAETTTMPKSDTEDNTPQPVHDSCGREALMGPNLHRMMIRCCRDH